MKTIDLVLFDLDDTVWEYRRSGPELLALAFDEVDLDPCFTAQDYYERIELVADDADNHAETRRRAFGSLAAEAGHDREDGRAVADVYTRERDYRDVRLRPHARETLDTLCDAYRLAAVTNSSPEAQRPKFAELGLIDTFEQVVYAGYDTAPKPDPEPFEVVRSEFDVAADRTVHVGNSLSSDVEGANAAGVGSVWIPEDGSATVDGDGPTPDYQVSSLRGLQSPPWVE